MRVGLVSSGSMAKQWTEVIGATGVGRPAALFSTDSSSSTAAAGLPVVGSPEALLQASDLIWVPASDFPSHSLRSLATKPTLLSTAALLADTALPAVALPQLPLRFRSEVQHLRTAIQADKLGTIGMARVSLCLSATPAPSFTYEEISPAADALDRVAPHAIDCLRWCFGEIDRIHAVASTVDHRADYALLVARLTSGAIAHLECSLAEAAGDDYLYYEIAGSNGILEYDSRNQPLLEIKLRKPATEPQTFTPAPELIQQLAAFLKQDTTVAATAGDWSAVHHHLNAARKSAQQFSGA